MQTTDRLEFNQPSGPNAKATRARLLRDLGDEFLPEVKKLKSVSKPALLWLQWAHSSVFSGDKSAARKAFENLRWFVYLEAAERIELRPKDDVRLLFGRLFAVIELIVRSHKSGGRPISTRDLAAVAGVDQSQFVANRRRSRIVTQTVQLFISWEGEIIEAMASA